jgi:uncharacterized repeat protein (TIGR01451 family)
LGTDPDPLVNTASANCTVGDGFGNVLTASDGHSVNLFQPSITLTKTGDDLSKVGDDVDYTITLTNTSSSDTPDLTCTVTDSLLGSLAGATLASGDPAHVINVTRTVLGTDPDPLVNTASANCTVGDGFGNVLTASDGHSVNLFQPSYTVTCAAFVGATDVTDGDVFVSEEVCYKFTITNTSSSGAPNLELVSATYTVPDPGGAPADVAAAVNAAGGDVLTDGESVTVELKRTVLSIDPETLKATLALVYSPAGFPNQLPMSASCTVTVKFGCALSPGFWGGGDGVSKWDDYTGVEGTSDPVAFAAGFGTDSVFPWLDASLANSTYLEVLKLPAKGDVTRQLAFKYIAARLNEASVGVPSDIGDLLDIIDGYFASNPVGSDPSGAAKDDGKALFAELNTYFAEVGEEHCPLPDEIPEL